MRIQVERWLQKTYDGMDSTKKARGQKTKSDNRHINYITYKPEEQYYA